MRTFLMASRSRVRTPTESEPVIISTDEPGVVTLELDDGDRLTLDERELRAALERAA